MYRHDSDRLHLQLVGTTAAQQFFAPMFFGRGTEVMHAAFLDKELRLLSIYSSAGSINEVHLSITEVTREAVLQDAHALIITHNHPSGKYLPSPADQQYTRDIAMVCERLNIVLVDYMIFTDCEFYSFREHGVIE